MSKHKYKTEPEELLKIGRKIMETKSDPASKHDPKYKVRVLAVNMVLAGSSTEQVSKLAGVDKGTVSKWVRLADEQGFDALRTTPQPGRPSRLTEEQIQKIDEALQKDAEDYGFKVWDSPSLSAFIKKEFDITLSARQCLRLFHRLGYSKIRPQSFPSKGYENTEERESFKKTRRNQK